MKITDVQVWVVNVPLTNPFTSSFETKTGNTRTVLRLRTDEGVEGWGETMHGQPVARLVREMTPLLALPTALAAYTRQVVAAGGFTAVKLRGTSDVDGDIGILGAIRAELPDIRLRVDPNAAWPVADTLRSGAALEELGLEYLEDPCVGIEGMATVRARLRIPLCTNMCVVRFEEFAPAVRAGAVDVIHGDVFKWGGIAANKALAAHCETFGLGMNLHSGGELGVSTAAHLALAGSTPALRYAIDSMYYLHTDDILTERLPVTGPRLTVPAGPGLGVTVDEDKLAHYAARNAEEGDLSH
ncbi:MAG: enolase C-terminal domain-like protein [Actinocatenispora sp.]